MKKARDEGATIAAENRIKRALRSNVPPSATYTLRHGQDVMVYSEKQRKWTKGLTVVRTGTKMIWVNSGKRIIKLNKTHVIPKPNDLDKSNISSLLRRLSPFNSQLPPSVLITEVLTPNDPHSTSGDFDQAIADEIVGLLNKREFRVVVKQEIGEGANILGGRFVLAIKNKGTDKEMFKARYVVQGHMDRDKEWLVQNSKTVSQQAIRLLISIATIFGFEIWSEDMTQAYLQGAVRILRKNYIRGKPELRLEGNELLEVLRPLYGLADAGDYWHATFLRHLKKHLGMTTTASDLSLHFKRVQSTLHGLIATHVDDTLGVGRKSFQRETTETARRFDAKPREIGSFVFAGVVIETNDDGNRAMHQQPYAERLNLVDKDCSFDMFRSRRHEL